MLPVKSDKYQVVISFFYDWWRIRNLQILNLQIRNLQIRNLQIRNHKSYKVETYEFVTFCRHFHCIDCIPRRRAR